MKSIFCLIFFLFTLHAHAQSIPLENVNSDDMNKIVGDFSANFLHTSVSGASSLGHIFGFEVGLVAAQTATPHLSQVANQVGQGSDASKLIDANLLGVLSIPAGLTVEVGLVPKMGSSSFQYDAMSAAVKFTPTELFRFAVQSGRQVVLHAEQAVLRSNCRHDSDRLYLHE